MRNTIWISMLSAALLGGAACHKKDDAGKAMDKAATEAEKAQENEDYRLIVEAIEKLLKEARGEPDPDDGA